MTHCHHGGGTLFKKSTTHIVAGCILLSQFAHNAGAVQNNFSAKTMSLLANVSATGAFEHLEAFQKIADENNGNRAAGTRGHEMSAHYVAQKLLDAGYHVEYQPFKFKIFSKTGKGAMESASKVYEEDKDFLVMNYSPSGSANAEFTAVDVALGLGNTSTSGCEAEDFKDFKKGNIALIQRGTCTFEQKAVNASNAGASGVVMFNQGNLDSEDRKGLFISTLGESHTMTIPVVATTYDHGAALVAETGTLKIAAQTKVEISTSFNVIAETKTGNPDNVVMLGSHLDGVPEGPGINDNGSGSAGILEVALKMKNVKTNNKIRFAWWSAEELGLIGSTRYVESLSVEEKNKIALYLNFDMIASPNYMIGVYDGDGSGFGSAGPQGSAAIEQLFHMFYGMYGQGSVETEFSGRSDYAAFALASIPVGGTFTGAEGLKTKEQAVLFGGEADVSYDVCYHKECDNLKNINMEALEINTDAIAYMTLAYGHSTASVVKDGAVRNMSAISKMKTAATVPISCHEEAYLK